MSPRWDNTPLNVKVIAQSSSAYYLAWHHEPRRRRGAPAVARPLRNDGGCCRAQHAGIAYRGRPAADGFIAQWQPQTDTLRQQVQAARNRLDSVNLPDSLLEWISELCCRLSAMS